MYTRLEVSYLNAIVDVYMPHFVALTAVFKLNLNFMRNGVLKLNVVFVFWFSEFLKSKKDVVECGPVLLLIMTFVNLSCDANFVFSIVSWTRHNFRLMPEMIVF